ncbi:MAG: energy transducer TonB [Oxalobacter sp.]|nr:MAG: energy transducer TonB [Oxalobacter sp.]
MTLLRNNPILSFAVAASLSLHGILLTVRFVSPEAFRSPPANPGLEVVLVNSKHDSTPPNPEALAQTDLDGGGNADAGRAKSPLPDMRTVEEGDSLKNSRRRLTELKDMQHKLMTQMQGHSHFLAPQVLLKNPLETAPTGQGADKTDSTALSRQAAEIARTIDDQNRRPKKTYISPSTKRVEYAMYYKAMQSKIERLGTLNFPQQAGKKLYGELTLSIPIFQDGSLYMLEGGPAVEQSSGNPALDQAALTIVRRSAPFGAFPPNMLLKEAKSVWVVFSRFKFTREDALQTQMYRQE